MADSKLSFKLYSYFRSSSTWRVRIAMNLKSLDYEIVPVNLLKNEQNGEEYKKAVPTLSINDTDHLVESMAICEYLESFEPKLLPANEIQKAKIRAVCEVINSGIQPLQNLNVLTKLEKEFSADKIAWASHFNAKGLKIVEEMIKNSAGKYCFGDTLTLADVFLVPQVYSAVARFNVDIEETPTVKAVYNNLISLEAFIKADPSNQPDCPK